MQRLPKHLAEDAIREAERAKKDEEQRRETRHGLDEAEALAGNVEGRLKGLVEQLANDLGSKGEHTALPRRRAAHSQQASAPEHRTHSPPRRRAANGNINQRL